MGFVPGGGGGAGGEAFSGVVEARDVAHADVGWWGGAGGVDGAGEGDGADEAGDGCGGIEFGVP